MQGYLDHYLWVFVGMGGWRGGARERLELFSILMKVWCWQRHDHRHAMSVRIDIDDYFILKGP